MPKALLLSDAASSFRATRLLQAKKILPPGRPPAGLQMPSLRMLWIFLFTVATGCQPEPSPSPSSARERPQAIAARLTVWVVDDPPLAAGIKLLRGEWAERSGGQIDLQECTVDQLLAATELPADLIVYPSRYVGTLVDRAWLRPVRESVLRSSDLAVDDMLPLVRDATIRYGSQVYGLSLGEPPLMLAGQLDEVLKVQNSTWQQVNFRLDIENTRLKQPRAAELLVRGIASAQHRSQSTDWFDSESMQPQIASPPFIRALEQMLENEKLARNGPQHSLALSWPSAPMPTDLGTANPKRASPVPSLFVPLPRADQIYNPLREIWEENDAQLAPVCLGFAGRSASVTRWTRNSASAFKLLIWMVSENIATQISSRSASTVWFRNSQVSQADKWLSRSAASNETAAVVTDLLSSDRYYLLPRILGIDDYLQVLDAAVSRAIAKNQSAEETLTRVADQWNELTDQYGRDRQRVAYGKHLGISSE